MPDRVLAVVPFTTQNRGPYSAMTVGSEEVENRCDSIPHGADGSFSFCT